MQARTQQKMKFRKKTGKACTTPLGNQEALLHGKSSPNLNDRPSIFLIRRFLEDTQLSDRRRIKKPQYCVTAINIFPLFSHVSKGMGFLAKSLLRVCRSQFQNGAVGQTNCCANAILGWTKFYIKDAISWQFLD